MKSTHVAENIPLSYPYDMTSEQIRGEIDQIRGLMKESENSINSVMRFSPLLQLGIVELQSRENAKTQKTSLLLSKIAIFISVISILVSFCQTYRNQPHIPQKHLPFKVHHTNSQHT